MVAPFGWLIEYLTLDIFNSLLISHVVTEKLKIPLISYSISGLFGGAIIGVFAWLFIKKSSEDKKNASE